MRRLLHLGRGGAVSGPFVGATSTPFTSSQTPSDALPDGVRAGDLLLGFLASSANPAVTGPADWSLVLTQVSGTSRTISVWRKTAAEGESGPYDWGLGSAQSGVTHVLAYRPRPGVTAAVDASAGRNNASGPTALASSVTTTGPGRILIVSWTAVPVITAPASMADRAHAFNVTDFVVAEEFIPATGATGTRTATLASSASSVTVSLALTL